MKFTQIKESCLYIHDLELAEAFYHKMLRMPIISKVKDRHIFFRCGNAVLLCFLPEATKNESTLPPHFATGKQHIAFEVSQDDYQESINTLKKSGIQITHEQEWKDGLKSSYFEDPFGHVLEIVPDGIWE
ncbi:VOC family protein [Cecembia lonarensis]|uniref:Fosfomycin resistance protein FosB n=1 Tax=Cecembia lonarensis (strain CCUG 58316 / KCTC 22772 / LW9) TaxID=1225176 RepID=K1LEZ3_CECL9|nr:VOC family protein [Cecembia lonarensis]EKB50712.1 fosfomycin resistance protein FosB [Cecembia lonarensis LW9]